MQGVWECMRWVCPHVHTGVYGYVWMCTGVQGCARVPPVATIRHRASQVLPTSHHRGWSCHWTISDLLKFSPVQCSYAEDQVFIIILSKKPLVWQVVTVEMLDRLGMGKKATGCLWGARFLAPAAHVDGNADADSVADEDDLLNSEAVNTQRSCTIGPRTHP